MSDQGRINSRGSQLGANHMWILPNQRLIRIIRGRPSEDPADQGHAFQGFKYWGQSVLRSYHHLGSKWSFSLRELRRSQEVLCLKRNKKSSLGRKPKRAA
ncbi:hypothetical protein QL285_001581 [Trifolium repens]|nr:hypothetical protein QL285_001581 [Trifolium repens]